MFKKFIILWLPVIIWAGLIFYLSSIPDLKTSLETFWDIILRKIAHIVEYSVLFLLLSRAMKKPLIWPIIISILYAILDEFHQSFVPGRNMALLDVCFDSAGILLGFLGQLRINRCRKILTR